MGSNFRYYHRLKTGLLTVLLFCAYFSIAQSTENVFTFKPVIGINACQIHGDNAAGYNKFGVNGGIVVNSRLNKKTSIDLGIVFTQKGARRNQDPENNDYTFFRVNLNYIEMPVLLNYKVNSAYFITLGPSLAYLVNYTEDTERGNWNGVYPFEKFEYGINVGLGRKIKGNWLIEIRSSNSFLPIRSYGIAANGVYFPNAVARFFNKGLYNNVLSAYMIYQINPKKKSETINP